MSGGERVTPNPVRMWATWHPRLGDIGTDGYMRAHVWEEELFNMRARGWRIIPGRFVPDKVRKGRGRKAK